MVPGTIKGTIKKQHGDEYTEDDQGGEEDVGVRQEGCGAVAVCHGCGISQDKSTDLRSDDPWNKHLGQDAKALESAGHMLRCVVAKLRPEDCHTAQISGHHQQGSDKYRDPHS